MTDAGHVFADHERPVFPGSPYTPEHPRGRRAAYAVVGLTAGVAATLGNALVNANVANLSGSMGVYVIQASLLPAVYVAFNVTANLMLVKGRAQFGVPAITQGLLAAYAACALLQLCLPGFASALLVRAVCGMTAAALITFGIYHWMQALPVKLRPVALVLGISLPQLALPIARMFPIEMLAMADWRGLYLTELTIALALLGLSLAIPLPPSDRTRVFEWRDGLTFGLVLCGMLAMCGALSEGRLLWWTDTPAIGWAFVVAVVCFAAAILHERGRRNPLLQLGWLTSADILRFAAVALLVRLALAEQTFGAVGLLTSGGLTNDQLRFLFFLVCLSMLAGAVVAVATLSETRLPYQVIAAALIIALGAWLDAHATNLSRPPQLYLSQCLIGFGTTLFVGPAILFGFIRMFQRGADHLVSFIVLFSGSQNIGGIAGSALLGSLQTASARFHAASLSEHLTLSDPSVVSRFQAGTSVVAGVVADPVQRAFQGSALLAQALNREAAVLAYNDVFLFVCGLALATALYVAGLLAFGAIRRRITNREATA